MSKVKVYVTNYCTYCAAAKRWLAAIGVDFDTIDVSTDAAARTWLVQTTGMRTVPQIFVGERSVGGYDDMRAMDARGEFVPLLDEHGVPHSRG